MPSQPPRHPTNAKRAHNTSASTPNAAPTPTRLTMALAWVFVLGMLMIGLAAIFLVTRAF
jgi:hypothetical protein